MIADQLKNARIAKNWTQKQLAYFSGMSIEMIRKLEHGQTNPRLSSIEKLAGALGYEIIVLPFIRTPSPDARRIG